MLAEGLVRTAGPAIITAVVAGVGYLLSLTAIVKADPIVLSLQSAGVFGALLLDQGLELVANFLHSRH